MAIKYLEASTMEQLCGKIDAFEGVQWKRNNGPYSISWVNIQKEGNKYICIASSTPIKVFGGLNTWEQNTVDVNVTGGALVR